MNLFKNIFSLYLAIITIVIFANNAHYFGIIVRTATIESTGYIIGPLGLSIILGLLQLAYLKLVNFFMGDK